MSNAHTKVYPGAEQLISVPRAHLSLELRQDEAGVALLHDGKPLVECSLTREGMIAAGFLAEALGAKVPALGETLPVRASTGVLFRAVSISELDFGNDESYVLLQRLLDEAAMQRGGSSDAV